MCKIIFGYGSEEEMMLYADPTERAVLSTIFADNEITFQDNLEEMTGADALLTPLPLPVVPVFMFKHFSCGAVMVQLKRKNDFPSSVGNRAAWSLGKMIQCMEEAGIPLRHQNAWQKVLLSVGGFGCASDGKTLTVDGLPNTHYTYQQVLGTIQSWLENGGVYDNIPRMELFSEWVRCKTRHFNRTVNERERLVMTTPPVMYEDDEKISQFPLQKLVPVTDWRKSLLTFPQMGEVRVQALYAWMKGQGMSMTFWQALEILTDPVRSLEVPTLPRNISLKTRTWLGIYDEVEISLQVIEKGE